jgi:hypothetical protein
MNKEHLKLFVEQNPKLVKMTESNSRPGIFVLKYTRRVFYDNLWSDELEHCRGAIVDKDFNLISYPFQKIYNYQIEDRAPVLADDVHVTAYRKINGFMVACTWYRDDVLISTTGSTDSPYVAMACEMIGDNMDRYRATCKHYEGNTFMFECVHPNDPHIIPEQPGMYLLGMRKNEWCSPVEANAAILMVLQNAFRTNIVQSFYTSMGQLLEEVKTVKHEGFVFYTDDGNVSSKLKSPYYLTSKWVARNPRTDKLVDLNKDIKHNLDEEYYPLVDAIRANIVEYTAMDEQDRLVWVRNFLGTV